MHTLCQQPYGGMMSFAFGQRFTPSDRAVEKACQCLEKLGVWLQADRAH